MDDATMLRLARWLRAHDGVITRGEAERIGAPPSAQRRLVRAGRWVRVHPGVFAESSAKLNPTMALRAALAAAGTSAMASHRSAGWLWDLLEKAPGRPSITVPRGRCPSLDGVVVHRSTHTGATRSRQGLRVTDPVRTLIDLAATGAKLSTLVDRALYERLVTVAHLERATRPDPDVRRPGVAKLRRHLRERGHIDVPEASELERRMRAVLRRAHAEHGIPLPQPEVAWQAGRYRVDFAWPEILLGVEVDGYVWHASEASLAYDLRRRNALQAAGWLILAYTWHQVVHDEDRVLDEVVHAFWTRWPMKALSAAGGHGWPR